MNDTAKKLPIETEKTQAQAPDMFRERGALDSLLFDVDRAMDAIRRRFWHSPMGRTVSDIEPYVRAETGWALSPLVDIVEKDKHYQITAELPGLDPENIELKIANDTLTIKGEKKQEREEKKQNYHFSERRYGAFQRSFTLPAGIDADKIEANFKSGVLTVLLPKTEQALKNEKKIAIRAG